MSGPTTPCVACFRATPLGGNVVTHYGQLGDLCQTCSQARLAASAAARCPHPAWEEEGDESEGSGWWVCTACGKADHA